MLAFLEQIDNARKDILAITKSTRGLLTRPVTTTEREAVVIPQIADALHKLVDGSAK